LDILIIKENNKKMKKKFLILITIFIFILFFIFWSIVSGGYDKQNKSILFLKKIIPLNLARKVRDTIFIIPNLKEKNKILSLQVEKYEQGYKGSLFYDVNLKSTNEKYEANIKKFFLPFPRLDLNLGWHAEKNSKRAHYLEIVEDKILVSSGLGETIYFDKNNISKKELNQKKIFNNIENIFQRTNNEFIGIRDLFYEDNFIYISVLERDKKGFTINIYRAEKNFKNLQFKLFFQSNEYSEERYSLQTGGRIEKFIKNKILFSIGFLGKYNSAQNKDSLAGKIISIDKDTLEHNLMSVGHRNPQGLFFIEKKSLIINTEHGPQGGDEINFNFLSDKSLKNYGWPISSYGIPYPSQDKNFYKENGFLKKSHSQYGFLEPIKYFTPSIGISEIIHVKGEKNIERLFVASLRAASIYMIELNKDMKKISQISRFYFDNNRIRDLKYDEKTQTIFMIFENTPAIGVFKIN